MTGGYASFVGFTANGERGVVVLTNIARDVAAIGMDALLPEREFPKEIAITPAALSAYAGRYRLAPNFDLVVRVDGNQLRVTASGQSEFPVYASGPDEFFYKAVDAQLTFQRDAGGNLTGVVLHQSGRSMPGPRVTPERKEIKLSPADLKAYIGHYTLTPTFAFDVTAENGQLYVQATAQSRFPVFASAPDEFFYTAVDARLTFERAADGSVSAVVLHQNGRNLRGEKQTNR
jgi:hypothetical protein